MSAEYDLNALVEQGKDDVLHFVRKNLFAKAGGGEDESSVFASFFLAVKKQRADLDLVRVRNLLIEENQEFLSGVPSGDPNLVYAMARAAGRVAQMKECVMAAERIRITHADADNATIAAIENLKAFLLVLEKTCVKLTTAANGGFELLPMSAVYEQEFSPIARDAQSAIH